MKMRKRKLTLILCALMFISTFSVAFAQDNTTENGSQTLLEGEQTDENGSDTDINENNENLDSSSGMTDTIENLSSNSMLLSSLEDGQSAKAVENETYGGKTITISKSWKGDDTTTQYRPTAATFELYASNSDTAVATLTLTEDDATMTGGNTWKATFDGKYPIYDENGDRITYTVKEVSVTAQDENKNDVVYTLDANQTVTYPAYKDGALVEKETYRAVQNQDNTTTSEGYENVSVYVPVTTIEEGEDYLVASGTSGNVYIYRAEAYQTDHMIATADGDVSAVANGTTIEGVNEDGSSTLYTNYILIADEETGAAVGEDGKYLTDYMTWRANYVSNNTGVLSSNFYRLCGLVEENDASKYPGYMSTKEDKGYGLCMYKSNITSLSDAPSSTQFTYDSTTGGFKTASSDKVVYLYKKITLKQGTLENETETFDFTNWKNSTSNDPLDTGEDNEIEPYTEVEVNKEWGDGKDHSDESVTVVLYANGVEEKEMVINADSEWKGTFESLPTKDSDGNNITYTVAEKSVKDSSGNVISYDSTVVETTDEDTETSTIWLPVDRPSKKAGGQNYIVVAFPTTESEIGENIGGTGSATRKTLTSNTDGTKFTMGIKNKENAEGASYEIVVTDSTDDPIVVGGKSYTSYITDDQAHNADGSLRTTIIWQVGYVGTASSAVASHADYGPWERDLYYFKALAGNGGYLSTQGAMTLESTIKTDEKSWENNRSLFAYGMMYDSQWGDFSSMTKQGYTKDQITHMIGAMDHYALRSDKSPGKYGENDCIYPAMYLYQAVEKTTKSFTITNAEKKVVTAEKVWKDDDNQGGQRASKISVELFRNDVSTGKIIYLSDSNNWSGSFTQLDTADKDGNAYVYTVKEHVSNSQSYETTYETETDSEGNLKIKITNTLKATAIEVPNTGSSSGLIVGMTGFGLLIGGLLLMIKTNKKREVG